MEEDAPVAASAASSRSGSLDGDDFYICKNDDDASEENYAPRPSATRGDLVRSFTLGPGDGPPGKRRRLDDSGSDPEEEEKPLLTCPL